MLNNTLIDLHVHTTASDGTYTPAEVVEYAKSQGLRAIAITDHDTVSGIAEAVKNGLEVGLEVVPGVEISVDHSGKEMHILGYYIDIHSPVLLENLSLLQYYRNQRNPIMVEKLCNLGLELTLEEVEEVAGGEIVGRPHFATLLAQKGYVMDKQEAFERYLAQGRPAYVKKEKFTPQQGIQLIRAAGGIPVLAHPSYLAENTNYESLTALIQKLKTYGLQGIEVYYSSHTREEEYLYKTIAQNEELVCTGGSDFHGDNKPEIKLGIGQGNLRIPYKYLDLLKNKKLDVINSKLTNYYLGY